MSAINSITYGLIAVLELRPNCERCNRDLPPDSGDAMICTFECTFCRDCVDNALGGICPNCGGNFELRPVRPPDMLRKYPPSAGSKRSAANPATCRRVAVVMTPFGAISPGPPPTSCSPLAATPAPRQAPCALGHWPISIFSPRAITASS